jgi:hypothetical protein
MIKVTVLPVMTNSFYINYDKIVVLSAMTINTYINYDTQSNLPIMTIIVLSNENNAGFVSNDKSL